jgi:hypothetical protein
MLRYDQRGSGLSEKVHQPITTELLVEDLEAVLNGSGLAAPYHFVTVAAATITASTGSTATGARNTAPSSTPTVAIEVELRRRTTQAISNHRTPEARKSHQ